MTHAFEWRLRRAHEHLTWIEAFAREWQTGNCVERLEPDAAIPGNSRVMVTIAETPAEYPLTVIVSECVHNMRSALDQLAFDLAEAHTAPLPTAIEESSEFPIFGGQQADGRAKFEALGKNGQPQRMSGRYKVSGIHPDAQDIIEFLQPYNNPVTAESDNLWLLHDLDRIGKHRALMPVAAAGTTGLRVIRPMVSDDEFPLDRTRGLISVGTIALPVGESFAGSWPLRSDIAFEDLIAVPTADVRIAFRNYAPLGSAPMYAALSAIYRHIVDTVVPPLRPFLP